MQRTTGSGIECGFSGGLRGCRAADCQNNVRLVHRALQDLRSKGVTVKGPAHVGNLPRIGHIESMGCHLGAYPTRLPVRRSSRRSGMPLLGLPVGLRFYWGRLRKRFKQNAYSENGQELHQLTKTDEFRITLNFGNAGLVQTYQGADLRLG